MSVPLRPQSNCTVSKKNHIKMICYELRTSSDCTFGSGFAPLCVSDYFSLFIHEKTAVGQKFRDLVQYKEHNLLSLLFCSIRKIDHIQSKKSTSTTTKLHIKNIDLQY